MRDAMQGRRGTAAERGAIGGRGQRLARVTALLSALALVLSAACSLASTNVGPPSSLLEDRGLVGDNPSGPGWTSGVWLGGNTDTESLNRFGAWRGARATAATTYPAYGTWAEIEGSEWHVSTFNGFEGKLVYGLPLLPSDEKASLADVAAGRHDEVWRTVARTLRDHDRGDSYVRIGLEANGTWFPWGATAESSDDFKAAYRRVAGVLRAEAADLQLVFDISCGVRLTGSSDRLASLELLYPGDDVVDVVGCDHYDSYSAKTRNEKEWQVAVAPAGAAGLHDVLAFARAHGKPFAVPEWGLSGPQSDGSGDNPFFIVKMHEFFMANRDDLAFENYFDEPDPYLTSSLFQKDQNPRSAEVYRTLWSSLPSPTPSVSPTSTATVTSTAAAK